ncbi:MAG: VTT domain-containing protein [Gammaproteobacteria bacterium]|nr:VTT domain-containing protein [Gammaproteobacteria bacterium]
MITVAVLIVLTGIYLVLANSEYLRLFTEPNTLVANIRNMGIIGPILIIGLMSIAIVLNPLPSAPIALAAGAVYGHTLGTVYIVAGAELGAILAFAIARWAGYDLTRRFFGETGTLQRISSQNTLTALVFVSRLIPFMSFDLISYAAGLSPIKLWRFAVATLLGLIPVSFALAHFGSEIGDGNYQLLVGIVLVIGLLTVTPLLLRMFRLRNPAPGSTNS